MAQQKQPAEVLEYSFDGNFIQFRYIGKNVMVNATQMAKVFDKLPKDFIRNDNTKAYMKECLKKENSPFLSVENEEDLLVTKQKSGTWMHRVLALKFAAWLNPKFELWVFVTIDHILFGHLKQMEDILKESATRRNKMKELSDKLQQNPDFLEWQQLQIKEKQSAYRRGKIINRQRDIFEEMMFNT